MKSFITIFLLFLVVVGHAIDPVDTITGGGALPKASAQNQCLVSGAAPLYRYAAGSCSAGAGDVVGPASSTNNDPACFDGTTGKLLEDCADGQIPLAKLAVVTASEAMCSTAGGVASTCSGVSSTELGYVNGVTSAIQTQLDARVVEVSSTDNAAVRFDSTGGAVQNSGVIIDDSNNVSGVGTLASGAITATASAGPHLIVKDGGTFGTGAGNADPYVTFNDNAGFGGRVGFLDETNALFYIENTRNTSMILETNNTTALTISNAQVADFANAPTAGGVAIPTISSTSTFTNKTFDADGTGNSITNIENADIKAAAAIAVNKLAALTASEAVVTDGSGFLASATGVSATELGYVNGVTSAIQTQMDAKLPTTGVGLVEMFTGFLEAPVAKTYPLVGSAEYAFTINTITTDCVSGSVTSFDLEINGTNVTGIAAVDMTTTEQTDTATAANSVSAGDRVSLVLNTISTPVDCEFTVKWTR